MNEFTLGIIAAITGYVLLAVSALGDKFLVTKTFREPAAYAAWVGMLSLLAFVLLPFDFHVPTTARQWVMDVTAGGTFVIALVFLYRALRAADASTLMPLVGVVATILTGLLAYFFIGERLGAGKLIGVAVLLVGFSILRSEKLAVTKETVVNILIAAVLFGISNVLMKQIFTEQPFLSGLAFTRLGEFAVGLTFLTIPAVRADLFEPSPRMTGRRVAMMLGVNALSAAGGLLALIGFKLSSPTVVNALGGVQYALLFVFGLAVSRWYPQVLKEQVSRSVIIHKLTGLAVIIAGLAMVGAL